ncbi:putative transcriptional regulator, AraC/XylS family [Bradyrhizobium sp. ORS 278]|uniref:AraC family transcriptional regulator n=1 Tax=Bradyrhizobium sp. (strain ORS 278) TaxID=114615 RepID=UPI00015081E0|nr:AraC family transcriptional regulator [Bradyrhizobium sp. ORS 278]CAL80278.1 putative transcriptional regulator, AraC/XylS family [Bradyrhizobium sp. ORS 278]
MDPFAALFAHVTPRARTFFAGNLCNSVDFTDIGHLHLFKGGVLTLTQPGADDLALHEPMLLFFPRGRTHRFVVDPARGADLVCATVELGGAEGNPIGEGLPELIVMPIAGHPTLAPVCDLLMAEGFADDGGRQAALDRLFDYLLILIVRHVVAHGGVASGVLAGLADPRLAKALTAIHDAPARPWSLDDLADIAGMSRTRFADAFRTRVGRTPIEYLTLWRMALARQLLARGRPVKSVASQVGYDSAAAFSRVFSKVSGRPPRALVGKA